MGTLLSPGVQISVTDESFFAGADEGTIPLVVFATRSNKSNPNDTDATQPAIAPGSRPEEAGRLQLITSQRELIQTFGEPTFVQEAGTPLHGDELNEYGLHALSDYLGVADRVYALRADVNLEELEPRNEAPVGPPTNGTYWLDLTQTSFGIFQGDGTRHNAIQPLFADFNIATGTNQFADTFGNDGDFLVDTGETARNLGIFEKIAGVWFRIGTADWISAKGPTNLVGGGTGAAQVIYAPHTGIPPTNTVPTPHDQHIWIKTTEPNLGADYELQIFNATTGVFEDIFAPLFSTEAEAIAFYGASLTAGVFFVDYDASNGTHVIKRYDGTNFTTTDPVTFDTVAPSSDPADGTLWYSTDLKVDIMVSDGSNWLGYLIRFPSTDPNGPTLSASAPATQSDGSALVDNDLWIDTSDLENYPVINRWDATLGQFVPVDNTDQTTQEGILFADARDLTTTVAGLTSNTIDSDAPNPILFPAGTLLFNTRFSTFNVKQFDSDAVDNGSGPEARWVTFSGNRPDGSPYMGRQAQRRVVVRALQDALAGNEEIRSEFIFYNLLAAPGYVELVDEMIALNTDIKEIAFIVADTPARLQPSGTAIQAYALNTAATGLNSEQGRSGIDNPYVGQYYPWGLGTNLDGQDVMIPPSSMVLRVMAINDQQAYPWFAPAGYQRGLITNAQSVGFLNSEGEYQQVILNQGQRDTLQLNNINPLSQQPNRGLVVFGQKTLNPIDSALDRVNVARLINFVRAQLDDLLKPFLFEPNDTETRDAVEQTVDRFLGDILGKRGLFDFGVRVDETNNTPARIDRNELWVDIALQPIKSIEFIYVPIRIQNTGADIPA